MFNLNETVEGTKVKLKFETVINGEKDFEIDKSQPDEWPVRFYTGTTGMDDFIGNVLSIKDGRCVIRGVYRGVMCEVKNVIIIDKTIGKRGDRVMVTEHLNVDGAMDLIATKKPLLRTAYRDLNFINIGWSNAKRCRFLRIDVYTGETKILEQEPVFTLLKGKEKCASS